jgi:hypothetical protein
LSLIVGLDGFAQAREGSRGKSRAHGLEPQGHILPEITESSVPRIFATGKPKHKGHKGHEGKDSEVKTPFLPFVYFVSFVFKKA